MEDRPPYRCRHHRSLASGQSALPGSLLFAAGLVGNVLQLGLLWHHQLRARLERGGRPARASPFYLLVSALAATDLLGKCLLSPIVLAAYARNRSLSQLWPSGEEGDAAVGGDGDAPPGRLCQLFAFLMAFFGLAPTALLLAMALECWLSLGRPYFYERHASRRRGALLTGAAVALCALPPRTGAQGAARPPRLSAAARVEELRHLVLLALMTVLFVVCSLPVIIRAYIGAFAPDDDENADLTALRFFSVNSIVDPWVFIIFRTSVFRTCLHRVSRRLSSKRASHSQLLETSTRKDSGQPQ
ncbi:PREDICTED: prostaglandin D2 receptor-like [Gekko japonicus]|uniref:Prostaglandin D2 receptor-like n=1 Tax=Gekko japonicus TaxID=146911 RepID=A0ABM1KT21_GEKJA|nr:PREDICTED: prostaglandin D2 receptor-like [Gekko japonicus]